MIEYVTKVKFCKKIQKYRLGKSVCKTPELQKAMNCGFVMLTVH